MDSSASPFFIYFISKSEGFQSKDGNFDLSSLNSLEIRGSKITMLWLRSSFKICVKNVFKIVNF
jgi:hypothetical protein